MRATLNPIYTALSGKFKTVVNYAIGGVQFVRSWVQPSNPSTAMQDLIRSYFAQASQAFSALSDAHRATWTVLSSAFKKAYKDGTEYSINDKSTFVQVNALRLLLGQSISSEAPAYVSEAAASAIGEFTYDDSSTEIIVHATGVVGKKYLLFLSDGTNIPQNNQMRVKLPSTTPTECLATAASAGAITWTIPYNHLNIANYNVNGTFVNYKIVSVSDGYVEGGILEGKTTWMNIN